MTNYHDESFSLGERSGLTEDQVNEEIEVAYVMFLGDVMDETEKTWAACGPPTWDSYKLHIFCSFGSGFGAGYRYAMSNNKNKTQESK